MGIMQEWDEALKKLQGGQELGAVVKRTFGKQGRNVNEGDFLTINLYFVSKIELYIFEVASIA